MASQEYGCEIFNYTLPVPLSRQLRHHDQFNLIASLGARAVPTASFYKWENQLTKLLLNQLQSHAKSAGSPGQAAQMSSPSPQHGTRPPVVGLDPPMGMRGVGEAAPRSRAGV